MASAAKINIILENLMMCNYSAEFRELARVYMFYP